MREFIALLDHVHLRESDGLSWRGVLLLLLKCEEIVDSDNAPSPASIATYFRQVLSILDSFQRNPSNCTALISSLKSFSLMAIRVIITMGNKACCCDEKNIGGELERDNKMDINIADTSPQKATNIANQHKKEQDNNGSHHNQQNYEDQKQNIVEHSIIEQLQIPELSSTIKNVLANENFLQQEEQQPKKVFRRRFEDDFYEGQLDQTGSFPNGFGKLYKEDGSYYIGQFMVGYAHGKGAIIFPDGSFYRGEFANNQAEGQGIFKSKELVYKGQLKANLFHGEGKERSANHSFNGEYERGYKKEGLMLWTAAGEEYEYFGPFAANRFEGRGTLKEPTGTYRGDFIKGEKHGKGVYEFLNGLRYQGEYRYGQRSGKGTIFNQNNTIAYQGEFSKGLPHGEGNILGPDGSKIAGKWIEGIDEDLL